MELHERFINIATLDSSVFEIIESDSILQDSIGFIISKFIEDCFETFKFFDNGNKKIELLRLLLCKQYKFKYEENKEYKTMFHTQVNQFVKFLFHTKMYMDKENRYVICDIMMLQLVLMEDQENFIQLFENFRSYETPNPLQVVKNVLNEWYLRVLKCFLDAWELLYFLNDKKDFKKIDRTHLEHCKQILLSSVIFDLKSRIQCIDNNEWHALYPILSKIVNIAKNTIILSQCVHEILDKNIDLTTISVICDFIFPIDCLDIDIDYSLIISDNLWSLIQRNLLSPHAYNRKQALQLFKKLNDFIDLNEQNIKKSTMPDLTLNKIKPFICDLVKSRKLSIQLIRSNFIIIMEALEEKQKHLVIPTLSLVDCLIEGHIEHKSCGNCYDFSWIYCIFARIFMHDNNIVVKWGLMRSLKLNVDAYNCDLFIMLIIKALNNTFLYEKCSHENEPNIVTALTTWFNNFQSKNLHLIEKFINLLYKLTWGPITIYYVLQSLFLTSDKLDGVVKLQQEQLDTIRLLVETNIKLHPPMLRSMSQITLVKILSRFSEIQNLLVLCNILSIFSIKDLRETYCWCALLSWLVKVHYTNAINFISQVCETLINDDEQVFISMPIFALVIQLFYEGGIICQTEQCVATQKLTTFLLYLDKIDVRPYVKVSLIIKIIDFLYNLFDLQCYKYPEFIYKIFINYKEALFKFILKLFNNKDFDYKYVKICTKILKNVNYNGNDKVNTISIVSINNIKHLEEKCIQVLSNTNEYNEIQILFTLQSWSNISSYYKYEDKFFLGKIYDLLQICKSKEYKNKLTGKMRLDYYTALSKLIKNHVLKLHACNLKKNDDWLEILSSVIDIAGNKVLIYFGDILRYFIVNISDDKKKIDNLKCLITKFWNCNFESKREKVFWLATQKLSECVNSAEFLNYDPLKNISQQFMFQMLNDGDILQSLKYILLISNEINKHFVYFMETILNGLLHGQVMHRDQRIYMQTCLIGKKMLSSYKLKDGKIENFKAYDFLNRQCNIDAMIRAAAVVQLSKALHSDNKNASLFLPLIITKLLTIQNKRYFANSQLHRLKHRIFQILLILEPYLNKNSKKVLYNTLCDSIIQDSDQHSIRLMKEWLLIRIYLSNEDLLSDLWLFFDKVCDKRPNSANSIIGIIWHVAKQLSKEKLVNLIKIALPKLGICCMKQQFGLRLFGQAFFIKLYELLDKDSDIRIEYTSFYKAILESLQNDNFQKYLFQIDEHFFYTIFNPIEHYSLETIYHQLPRLTNVCFEEWILKENFKDQIFLDISTVDLKMTNVDSLLDQAVIPDSFLKCQNSKSKENEYLITNNIQKKITPWKIILPDNEELTQMTNLSESKNKLYSKQNIIMIASLVDKSQNLGGIARTCEIFGVKEFVISNLKQIEDKEFQFLSVSADKWIKILEVKTFFLDKYLMELKDSGWTLIGAEQTINSINLFNLKFPKKTVLILGNERNGIPSNILSLLDICVEIPQFGIVRSLNVHVTSAICLWEYIKQHRFIS